MPDIPNGPDGKPQPPDPKTLDCLSTACQKAQAVKVLRTNDFILKCGEIAAAEARAKLALGGGHWGIGGLGNDDDEGVRTR
jgi:hypothetical protein